MLYNVVSMIYTNKPDSTVHCNDNTVLYCYNNKRSFYWHSTVVLLCYFFLEPPFFLVAVNPMALVRRRDRVWCGLFAFWIHSNAGSGSTGAPSSSTGTPSPSPSATPSPAPSTLPSSAGLPALLQLLQLFAVHITSTSAWELEVWNWKALKSRSTSTLHNAVSSTGQHIIQIWRITCQPYFTVHFLTLNCLLGTGYKCTTQWVWACWMMLTNWPLEHVVKQTAGMNTITYPFITTMPLKYWTVTTCR